MVWLSKAFGIFAAMIPGATGASGMEGRPSILMVTTPVADGIRVQVIGTSDVNYEASFTLETESGGNRSVHRGSASFGGSAPVLLSTVTFGTVADGPWRAHLRVEPRGGPPYELAEGSS